MSYPIIRTEHLTRRLETEVPVTLVNDVSFEINRGEFVVIAGPSGSGKSSLLYLLGLLDTPTSGRVFLKGEDTSLFDEHQLAETRLSELGFVFQFHFLLPEFSVLENVMLPMRRLGKWRTPRCRERALTLLASLGLADHSRKLPQQLSGGQSQRVAIARALANDPLIIYADEPTGNLDSAASATVKRVLKNLVHLYQCTVIVVTHDTHLASTADRTLTIVDGRITP